MDILDANLDIALPKRYRNNLEVLGRCRRLTHYLAGATGLSVLPLEPEDHRAITLKARYTFEGAHDGPLPAGFEEAVAQYHREWVANEIAKELPAHRVTSIYALTFDVTVIDPTTFEPYCPVVLHAPRMDQYTVSAVQGLLNSITGFQTQMFGDIPVEACDRLAMLAGILKNTEATAALNRHLDGGTVDAFLTAVGQAFGKVQDDLATLLRTNDGEPMFLDPVRRTIRENVGVIARGKSDAVHATYRRLTQGLSEAAGVRLAPVGDGWRNITLSVKHRTGWTHSKLAIPSYLQAFVAGLVPELVQNGITAIHALTFDNPRLLLETHEAEFDVVLHVPM